MLNILMLHWGTSSEWTVIRNAIARIRAMKHRIITASLLNYHYHSHLFGCAYETIPYCEYVDGAKQNVCVSMDDVL